MAVQLDCRGGVLNYGREERLFPPGMRRALTARDRGCSFPDCDRPAAWCEAHHILEWDELGETSIENGTLVCGYHHREFGRKEWVVQLINRRAYWIPPAWIDPDQVPRLNTLHHVDIRDRE
jgi:hypothetical protein